MVCNFSDKLGNFDEPCELRKHVKKECNGKLFHGFFPENFPALKPFSVRRIKDYDLNKKW